MYHANRLSEASASLCFEMVQQNASGDLFDLAVLQIRVHPRPWLDCFFGTKPIGALRLSAED
jgi:hypothetical protein